jgi:hypothetical protein
VKEYRNADVKYNNGNGALLCNRCSVIIAYGFEHVDDYHFCKECFPHWKEWMDEGGRNK